MKSPLNGMHPVKRLGWVSLISLLVLALGVVWDNWGDMALPSKTASQHASPTSAG